MKVICIDISGKVYKYDEALYNSIVHSVRDEDEIICLTPYDVQSTYNDVSFRLISLIPKNKANSSHLVKRFLKALECLINYCRLLVFVKNEQPDIIHLQWLPFLEQHCMIEFYVLKFIKKISFNTKIILTVHNIFPHDISTVKREKYRERFAAFGKVLDFYIVHTKESFSELKQEFGIDSEKISVINHGVFMPSKLPIRSRENEGVCRFLLYGYQFFYKGTDLLIDALRGLTDNVKKRIEVRVIGQFSPDLYEKVKELQLANVYINNSFVNDDVLYEEIVNSDVLLFPYRKISQSGALLLGLYFNKPMILSDLPSFRETLSDYPEEMFFENGNVESLKKAMLNYLNSNIVYKDNLLNKLKRVKEDNSWEKAAQLTLQLYYGVSNGRNIELLK